MASTWSDNLKIELLGTGDTNWGTLTNNNFKWALEESITGYGTATFPSDADYDWGAGFTNSNSSQAQRNLVVRVTGTISTTRNLLVPLNSAGTAPIEKQYIFWNDTTGGQAIVVKTPSGTGVTIPNGVRMHVFVDGTNVVQMDNYDVSRTVGTLSLTNALSVANGGTGATTLTGVVKASGTSAFTAGNVSLTTEVTGTLPVANGGTGITSFGTGVAVALGQNVTGSGGIVLATSPSLTTPNLGTPSAVTLTNATGLPLATGVTGTLPVANGGTGLTSFGTGVATALGQNVTGSDGIVLATSPTLSAPNLGTPSAVVLTNATGLPLTTGVTGTLPVANGGTGITSFGTGVATALGQNVTGSGGIVLATSPVLTTPTLGAASATSVALDAGAVGTPSLTATGDLNTGMWFPAADTLAWSTGGSECMRINSSGNVGIGTNLPSARLHVSGSTDRVAFFNSTNDTEIAFATNNAVKATIYTDFTSGGLYPNSAGIVLRNYTYGNGGVKFILANGFGSPTERFNITEDGTMICGGVYNTAVGATNRDVYVDNTGKVGYLTSIRASKTNIADLSDVSWLYQLNPVTFRYRKKDKDTYTDEADGPVQFGLIAEDVETVKPELCFYDVLEGGGTELKGVSYSSLITPLLKAVQQLKDELEVAKTRIAALEQK